MSVRLSSDIKSLVCSILGTPEELEKIRLPQNQQILRYWKLLASTEKKPGLILGRRELVTTIATEVFNTLNFCERSRAKRGELASLRKARELMYRYMGKQNN